MTIWHTFSNPQTLQFRQYTWEKGWGEARWLELGQGHPVTGGGEYFSSNKYLGEGWREVRWLELCQGHPVAGGGEGGGGGNSHHASHSILQPKHLINKY